MSSSIVGRQETSAIKHRQKFEGHTDLVERAIHLPDGQRMMTCSRDGSLRIWNLKSGKQIGGDWRDGDSELWTIALSPDGKKVVSGGSVDGGVKLWDVDTGKIIAKWMGHTKTVRSMCWSRDGQRVVSGSEDGTVSGWNVEKGEIILCPIETGHNVVLTAIYSPDMTLIATGGHDWPSIPDSNESLVKIWDAKTGELVATLKGHTNWVWCLAWTPDGKTLTSGSADHSIRTWNTTTWKQIALLDGHTNIVYGIAISPNGRILASASTDKTARLWDLDNTDGKLLATGCIETNAYLWDVSAILKEVGLDQLLDQRDESLLVVDATRRPVRQPIKVSPRVPRGFFDDTPNRAHLSGPHSLSSPSHRSTLRSRFLSLFRPIHPDAHDAPSRPHPFHWVRNRLFARPSNADIELHERPLVVVDVPYAKGKRRNASARERRRPIPKLIRTNATAGSSHRPNSSVTQQSSGTAQVQSSSQSHASVSTVLPVVGNTTSSTTPHVTIKYPARWTRFWLFICCASPEYTDGHP